MITCNGECAVIVDDIGITGNKDFAVIVCIGLRIAVLHTVEDHIGLSSVKSVGRDRFDRFGNGHCV